MQSFSKQMNAFEATWDRYIDALDALDAVKDRIAEDRRRSRFGSRIFRTLRARRADVARIATVLRTRYDVACATEGAS